MNKTNFNTDLTGMYQLMLENSESSLEILNTYLDQLKNAGEEEKKDIEKILRDEKESKLSEVKIRERPKPIS